MTIEPSTSITPLVITFNEAPNIGRVLARLGWARRVLVIDSGSDDGTTEICRRFPNVEVIHRAFDGFASQCNFGLKQVQSEWCLSIDSDYIVPDETAAEIQARVSEDEVDGCFAKLTYCIRGMPLRGAILPPRLVLFRTRLGYYEQDGHAHRLKLEGGVTTMKHPILHDDRKSLRRWLNSQDTYAEQEAEKISKAHWSDLSWPDRVRRSGVIAPWLVPAICLFAKGGVRDGWAGVDYAAQRAVAELVLSIKLFERRQTGRTL